MIMLLKIKGWIDACLLVVVMYAFDFLTLFILFVNEVVNLHLILRIGDFSLVIRIVYSIFLYDLVDPLG